MPLTRRVTQIGRLLLIFLMVSLSINLGGTWGEIPAATTASEPHSVAQSFPHLTYGPLGLAQLRDLPSGVLLQAKGIKITAKDIESEIKKAPPGVREQLEKNQFFLLEQIATARLLTGEARQALGAEKADLSPQEEVDLLQRFLQSLTEAVSVSDEEAKAFYEREKDLFGGASFSEVQSALKAYLLQEKEKEAINDRIRTLGQRTEIWVDREWTKRQYALSRDNPVDQARTSGLPTLVDFGATGCRPCDMMTPVLEFLRKKYEGKLNVLFVHVGEEQIFGARYGIQGIPLQIFFDREGREVFRHTGFFAQAEIEKKLAEIGVE